MRERFAEGNEFVDKGLIASVGIFTFLEQKIIQSELGFGEGGVPADQSGLADFSNSVILSKNGRWPRPCSSSFFQKHIEHLIDPVRPIGQVKPKGGAEF
jgi:hypothetical protein